MALGRVRLGRAFPALLVIGATACTPTQGFECGTPLPSDNSVIRSCTEPHQMCICATNSCAAPSSDCASGFRYVGEPFANPDAANGCVDPQATPWNVPPGATTACGAVPDASAQDAALGDAASQGACTSCDAGDAKAE